MGQQLFDVIGNVQNWNWPPGVTVVTCECVGGSGGGGAANGNPSTGGGGRGGDYAIGTITKGAEANLVVVVPPGGASAVAGQSAAVQQGGVNKVLGAGGNPGGSAASASTNGASGAGTNGTSIGTTICAGGAGGVGNYTAGTQGSGAGGGAGGPGGAGTPGNVNTAGVGNAQAMWQDGVFVRSGNGAAGVGNSAVGANGKDYGGGGSGGKANTSTKRAGGTGSQGIVLLTWVDAPVPPLVAKVQASGSVRVLNTASFTITMPSAPTIGNSLVIGLFGYRESVDFIASITDNWGNTYQKAADGTTTNALWLEHASVWYCGAIVATGGLFTITVTCVGAGTAVNVDAIEYAGSLVLDQAMAGDQSFDYTPTAATPAAVSATAVLSMAVLSNYVDQSSIRIPQGGWIKEVEDLSAGAVAAGQVVTHGPTPNVVETGSWLVQDDSWTAVALAVFRSGGAAAPAMQPVVCLL